MLLVYRVYDPDNAADPTGGVGLPQVSISFHGVVTAVRGGCVGSILANSPILRNASSPGEARAASAAPADEPGWTVAEVTRLPNADAAYLKSQIELDPGQIVVIRAQVPTFPDTNGGVAPWEPAQVRYWSICDYGETTLKVAGCLADHSVVQSDGVATFVISTPQDQPPSATAADGVNWLPWPDTAGVVVAYRQILPAPSFGGSIAAIPIGGAVSTAMGSFYPQIALCSVSEFQSAGAAGCLARATPPVAATPGLHVPPAPHGATGSRAAILATLSAEVAPTGDAARVGALLKAQGYTFPGHELPERGIVHLTWWYAHSAGHQLTRVASAGITLAAHETGRLHARLTRAGLRLLRRHRRLRLTGRITFAPTGHAAIVLRRTFALSP